MGCTDYFVGSVMYIYKNYKLINLYINIEVSKLLQNGLLRITLVHSKRIRVSYVKLTIQNIESYLFCRGKI